MKGCFSYRYRPLAADNFEPPLETAEGQLPDLKFPVFATFWQRTVSRYDEFPSLETHIQPIGRYARQCRDHPQTLIGLDDINGRLPAGCSSLRNGIARPSGYLKEIPVNPLGLLNQIIGALPDYKIPILCRHKLKTSEKARA
jgi:hypothetical protein